MTITPRFVYGAIVSFSSISLSRRQYSLYSRTVLRENSPNTELHTHRKLRIESNLKRLKKEAKQQRGRQCIINEWKLVNEKWRNELNKQAKQDKSE